MDKQRDVVADKTGKNPASYPAEAEAQAKPHAKTRDENDTGTKGTQSYPVEGE